MKKLLLIILLFLVGCNCRNAKTAPEIPPYTSSSPPVMQSDVAVYNYDAESRLIIFHTTADIAEQFLVYSTKTEYVIDPTRPNEFWITVDARHDFMEVLSYINSFE